MSKLESKFQRHLKLRLKEQYPGCRVLKMDANECQGMPDLLILFEDKWAALEVKRSEKASHRPNQDYYIDKLNKMSFARFIFPENEEEVFKDLDWFFLRMV